MSFEYTIGIKLPIGTPSAKCVSVVRGATDLSISDIRTRAENDEYLVLLDGAEEGAPGEILRLYESLLDVGTEARLFDFGKPCSLEIIRNMDETNREIYAEELDEP